MADTTTTNLGLTKIEIGTLGWGSKINTNMDRIDDVFDYVTVRDTGQVGVGTSFTPADAFVVRDGSDYLSLGSLGVGGYAGFAIGNVAVSMSNYFIASDGYGVNINAPHGTNGTISFSRGNTGVGIIDTNNFLIIGERLDYGLLAGSTGLIQARAQGFDAKMRLQTVRSGGGNWLAFDRANGTFSSMTALLSGDAFGSVVGVGHYGNSSTFAHGPEIRLIASQNWSSGNYGCGIEFYTIQNGSTTQYRNMNLTEDGSLVLNHAALATNAQGGFLYIASCAGVATGTPATNTGRVPMVYDTTNNKLGIYNGAWKWVTLS